MKYDANANRSAAKKNSKQGYEYERIFTIVINDGVIYSNPWGRWFPDCSCCHSPS